MSKYIVLNTQRPDVLHNWLNENGAKGWELDKLSVSEFAGHGYIVAVMKKEY